MARALRLEFAGACYHVINRGNYRRNIFEAKGAAEAFEQCLFEVCEKCGWRLHAFVIMRNHFHLAVETPEPNLSVGMKWLQGTWAARFNRFRGQIGRPFQGRFKALHVEPGHALAQVAHYIHLNPVRAKVVTADRLAEFEWSSLQWFARKNRPAFFEAETVLAEAGGLPDTAGGWKKYQAYLALLAEEEPKKRDERFGRLSRGWVVGSTEFKQALRKDLRKKGAELERASLAGPEAAAEFREETWEAQLTRAAKALRINLNKLGPRKSSPEKVKLAAVMRAATTVSNGWLAARLAMGQPASVSQFTRRFKLAGGHEGREFQAALSRVKE